MHFRKRLATGTWATPPPGPHARGASGLAVAEQNVGVHRCSADEPVTLPARAGVSERVGPSCQALAGKPSPRRSFCALRWETPPHRITARSQRPPRDRIGPRVRDDELIRTATAAAERAPNGSRDTSPTAR
jgi:hypothetical protein